MNALARPHVYVREGKRMIAASPPPQRPPLDDHPPEPHAAVMDEAVDETEMPLPSDPRTFFLVGLVGLTVATGLFIHRLLIHSYILIFKLSLSLQPAAR